MSTLRNDLKERHDHQKSVILPKARYEWMHLRLQDFKSVSDYNSALFRITSKLMLCGEKITDDDMLEKTFSTFHASNVLLQQQYREKGFTKYSELISCLLVAEQNNELLMKNHESRPTGTAPFPEVNVAIHDHGQSNGRGRGRSNGRGHGRGRGHRRGRDNNSKFSHQKWKNSGTNEKTKGVKSNEYTKNVCHRCGSQGHWARLCRTPKHLVNLYQESLKYKGKEIETNFAGIDDDFDDGQMDVTHLDVADFFAHPEGKIDHLIGDGSVQK